MPIKTFNFSGGECHVSLAGIKIESQTYINAGLYCSDDIMCLLLTVDAVREVNANTKIFLVIPYFPYARQDRAFLSGAFSLRVMAKLINDLDCYKVNIYDPHSEVTSALIKRCSVITQTDILINTAMASIITEKGLALMAPDAGAKNKAMYSARSLIVDLFFASKVRDTITGEILNTEVISAVSERDLLVVDDICDGGRTFIELSKVLKEKGASDIYLYITHGIFSKGVDVVAEHFKHIYCFNNINSIKHGSLTTLEWGKYEN